MGNVVLAILGAVRLPWCSTKKSYESGTRLQFRVAGYYGLSKQLTAKDFNYNYKLQGGGELQRGIGQLTLLY